MANDFEVSTEVAVPPGAAWALAGDPARIGERFAPVVSAAVEGEHRTVLANGATLVERLVDRDEAARRTRSSPGSPGSRATSPRSVSRRRPAVAGCGGARRRPRRSRATTPKPAWAA